MKLFPFFCSATLLLAPAWAQGPGSLIGQVLSDIDRAAANAYLDNHERDHFNEVARQLQEFDARAAQGNFDKDRLDKAIENLDHVAHADRVSPQDRDVLQQDLTALRNFRATRGGGFVPAPAYNGGNERGYGAAGYPAYSGYRAPGIVSRVIRDLNRVSTSRRLDDHERNHIDSALRGLDEFDRRLAEGNFDKDRLDNIIENINHLANADRVRGRDRDMLRADLYALRDYRASRGRY